eukprot:CFRG2429T1
MAATSKDMFHKMKRSAMHTSKDVKTRDPEFDQLVVEFKKSHKQAINMQNSMRVSFNSWNALKKQLEGALSNAEAAFTEGEQGAIIVQNAILAKDKIDPTEAQQGGFFSKAVEYIDWYVKLCVTIKTKVDRRDDVRKDMDYYVAKADDLKSKGSTNKDKIYRADKNVEAKTEEYDAIHEDSKNDLIKAHDLKEPLFEKVLVAYLQTQNTLLSCSPFHDVVLENQTVLEEWPDVDKFTVKAIPTQRKPSVKLKAPTQPKEGRVVIAAYDFDAENDQELAFHAEDKITIIEEVDDNWYRGTFNGKVGIFPKTYVEKA